ncbi:MAG TPA: right-handed parallel beta-helix repeat-containing protein [Capillibacterium sp.]
MMIMKKSGWNKSFFLLFTLLIGAFFLFSGGPVQAGSLPVITVSTPEEFIEAIGPDRIIRIEADVLQLPDELLPIDNKYVTQEEVWDGYQLLIQDVANMTITGAGEKPVKILAQSRYAYIFAFVNAEKIKIEGVEAGHNTAVEGECMVGVLSFQDCRDIVIERSILFGCGADGVDLYNVDGFHFKNSVIKDCLYGIMTIYQSRNCLFSNSTFTDNDGYHLIYINNARNITFKECEIVNNSALGYGAGSIFDVSQSEAVRVEDCLVENNMANLFISQGTGLTVKGTPVENNFFFRESSDSENSSVSVNSANAETNLDNTETNSDDTDRKRSPVFGLRFSIETISKTGDINGGSYLYLNPFVTYERFTLNLRYSVDIAPNKFSDHLLSITPQFNIKYKNQADYYYFGLTWLRAKDNTYYGVKFSPVFSQDVTVEMFPISLLYSPQTSEWIFIFEVLGLGFNF